MNEHAELISEARELADHCLVDCCSITAATHSRNMLRRLADIVEARDKAFDEAVAACKMCHENIDNVIASGGLSMEGTHTPAWTKLAVSGHLAKRVADTAKSQQRIEGTLEEAAQRYSSLLERLAKGDSTNQTEGGA